MTAQTFVHPSAVVEPGARLGSGVRIGPFCHVSADAVIGDDVSFIGNVTVMGATTLHDGCTVYPGAVLGAPPQNLKHKGSRTTLAVGRDCTIREGVTMHAGSDDSRGETRVGERGFFMAYSHVAHDCVVGDHVTMANYAGLGGHSDIGDHVTISGYAAVHQFVRVGHHAFLGGYAAVVGDVIPYGMAVGDRARLRGLNVVGLKRAGIARSELTALRTAYRMLFSRERPLSDNIATVRQAYPESELVSDLLDFIGTRDKRYLTVPALRGGGDDDNDGE